MKAGVTGRYVSRAGEKLESVLPQAVEAGFDFAGRVVLDVGASTGGFSDCLLAHGARELHTVDVGYNLLDFSLRRQERVHVHERCNVMSLQAGDLCPAAELAVMDLSFRSLRGAAEHVARLLSASSAQILALVKPQFELAQFSKKTATNISQNTTKTSPIFPKGKALFPERFAQEITEFAGVVHSEELAQAIVHDLCADLATAGLELRGLWKSGLLGRKGNQEFFALFIRRAFGL